VPSTEHETLVELFRSRPGLAAELLAGSLSVPLPKYTEVRLEPTDLTEAVARELRADLLVLLLDEKPVLVIVLEVQLSEDGDKPYTWLGYLAGARLRYRCPGCVFVVTPDDVLANRLARPIILGPGDSRLTPLVLGPAGIPVITEEPVAMEKPELAVLSAMAHGRTEVGYEVAKAALGAAGCIEDGERRLLYEDFVLSSLNEAVRRKLMELLGRNYEFRSEFFREMYAEAEKKARENVRREERLAGQLQGLAPLVHQFERRIGRPLTSDERTKLVTTLEAQGADRLGDMVLDLSPEALTAWLAA